MKHMDVHVDTLACEASEADVVDGLLAAQGVLAASADFRSEHVAVSYDPSRVDEGALWDHLKFFGLTAA